MKFDYQKSQQLNEVISEISPFFLQYHCKKLHDILLEFAKRNGNNFPEETKVTFDFPNEAIVFTYNFLGAVPFCTTKTEDNQKLIALDYD